MPEILNLSRDDINSKEKRSKFSVGIIGCGQKGIVYANAFAQAGFKVICTDSDPSVIKKVARGKANCNQQEAEKELKDHIIKGQINVVSDLKKAVSGSDIIVIAFSAKMDEHTKIDTSHTLNACKLVGSALQQGTLVVYSGIASLGFTEKIVKETLENTSGFKVGKEFGLVYNPIQMINGSIDELLVAANDQVSLQAAAIILKTLAIKVKEIDNIKSLEALSLFTIAKRDVDTALANEFATFCEKANIDYFQILKFLSPSNTNFYMPNIEDEIRSEAHLLLENAENLNVKVRLSPLARQINEDMLKHAITLTQDALRQSDKTLRRARIAIFGLAQASTSYDLARLLGLKGARVSIYDPSAKKENSEVYSIKTRLNETVEGADCIIILSSHIQFSNVNLKKLKPLMKIPPVLVDLVGKYDQKEVKTEGFIYTGLGRGS